MLAEEIIDGVRLLIGKRVLQVHVLVGDVLLLHQGGGLLLDAFNDFAVAAKCEETTRGKQDQTRRYGDDFFSRILHKRNGPQTYEKILAIGFQQSAIFTVTS